MCSFFSSRPENSKLNNYFSICDLTNKYNLKNIFESPELFQIILEFSSADILVACENRNKKELDSELQIKIFFLLYVLESYKPFVNLNKVKITKENSMNYSVKIVLSSKKEIDSFLKTLVFAEDFKLIKTTFSKYNKYIKQNRKFILNTKIPNIVFFELDTFITKKMFDLSSKSLKIGTSFVFKNKAREAKKMSSNLIENINLFWAICPK
jgi:uncharacterized HAD superfamily protein